MVAEHAGAIGVFREHGLGYAVRGTGRPHGSADTPSSTAPSPQLPAYLRLPGSLRRVTPHGIVRLLGGRATTAQILEEAQP